MCNKCEVKLFLISVVIVSNLILIVTSFNIDTFNYAQYKGPEESMFGFSVATHREHGRNWVLVGAPESQGRNTRIEKGGEVFKCPTTNDNGCEGMDFHQELAYDGGRIVDDKKKQWFGATVNSAGPDGPVVACAPRYVWFTTSSEDRRDPVGTCYIARDDFRKFSEYSPCRTSLFGYHRQGSCQAGFSAGISKDFKRLFTGAPGSWYWQGQMYSIDPNINFPYHPGIFGEAFGFDVKGQIIQQSLDNRPAAMSTPEGPPTDDNSYLGYSMIVGDFNGEGVQGVAVGMPRGGEALQGKVLLYTWSLTNYLNITGEQLGAYFGYALATSDVDGDGRDDLIVGAPLHTEANNEEKYDVGRVHVFYQGRTNNATYSKKDVLDGVNSKARFGLSLCTLGDINLDGFGDFAVGAPYDGPNGAGAVYIFEGSANGIITKYTQVIYAETIQQTRPGYTSLTTFGFSLSGGLDLDGNDYPDLAVGAYLSDATFFFRSRPVVRVNAVIRFLTEGKGTINLEDKKCPKPGSTVWVACTEIEVCLSYTGVGTPSPIYLNLHYNLDSQKTGYSRMKLGTDLGKYPNKTIVLQKDTPQNCLERHMIYLDDKVVDKLTDLEITMSYSLQSSYYNQTQRDPRSILVPIVDLTRPAVVNDSISIFKNCGHDNICIPNLQLFANTTVDKYLYGIGKSLEFNVMIFNTEDDSYNTKYYINLPEGMTFKVANKDDGTKLACSNVNDTLLWCDIGNPLAKGSVVIFKLQVEPLAGQKQLNASYSFYMNVTSANPENSKTMKDNEVTVVVDIWVDAVLQIEGQSTPANVYYDISQYRALSEATWDTEIGPSVIHFYTITNNGPSDVEEVEFFIIWPYATLADEALLYLLEPPHILPFPNGVKYCDPIDYNIKNLTLATQRNVWDIFDVDKGTGHLIGPGGTIIDRPGPDKPRPPVSSNTITQTQNNIVFYSMEKNKSLESLSLIMERETKEYYEKIAEVAKKYNEPLVITSNSSLRIVSYVNGKEDSVTIKDTRPDDSKFHARYVITSVATTVINYYRSPGNLLGHETIKDGIGSVLYNQHIDYARQRWGQHLIIEATTTKHIECKGLDGKVLHQQTFTITATETPKGQSTTVVTYYTIVTFYNSGGTEIRKEIIEEEPKSKAYWEEIGKFANKYQGVGYVTINTTKIIKHIEEGREVKVERIPQSALPHEQNIMLDVKSTTTVTINTARGQEDTELIYAAKDTEEFARKFNEFISRNAERTPFTSITETIVTVTFLNSNKDTIAVTTIREINEKYHPKISVIPQPPTIRPPVGQTNRTTLVTTVMFYDDNGKLVSTKEFSESPQSTAFWEKVTKIVGEYQQHIRIRIIIKTIITFYANNQPIRTEQLGQPREETYTSQTTSVDTTIRVYNTHTNAVLQEGPIPVAIGTTGYDDYINKIFNDYRNQAITILTRTTYRIAYQDSTGRVRYTGTLIKEETLNKEIYRPTGRPGTSKTRTITTILFYGPNRDLLERQVIYDRPGSEAYWQSIKNVIAKYDVAVNIHTNTSRIVTYYVDGVESHTQHYAEKAGNYEMITTHSDITNVITFYDLATNQQLFQRTIKGKLSAEERSRISAEFRRTHGGNFKMETVTESIIYYRDGSGNLLHSDSFQQTPSGPATGEYRTHRVTRTTFTVYGSDRRTIIEQKNIEGEPGSAEYNNAIAEIMSRHPIGSITIYTNTTTTIEHLNTEGRSVDRQTISEPRSTVYRNGDATQQHAVTSITFYGSDGRPIHREDIEGSLGSELTSRLNEVTSKLQGLLQNYQTEYNENKNIGTSTIHTENRPAGSGQYFTDFDSFNNKDQSHWSTGYNQSYHYNQGMQSGGGYNHNYGGQFNQHDLNVEQDLGSFAQGGQGFRVGGIDLGVSSGVVDHNLDGTARGNLETFSRTSSYDGNHNYLNGTQTHYASSRHDSRGHQGRRKREEDRTDEEIELLRKCSTSSCTTIRCVTGPIKNRGEIHIALRARVIIQTLKNISMTQAVKIPSMLLARISNLQEIIGSPSKRVLYRQQAITSIMAPLADVKPDMVPLWVVILSAVAGTLILLLLIFLLHKCGFFKRNRPSDAPERQPLNRNGHFQHGDEAL